MVHRGISLKCPGDARKAVQRIVSNIFKEGSEIENAAKVAQLLNIFLRAWELDKLSDVEKRLAALEGGNLERE